ncbi:GumC family protein [Methylobacterium soli]|uniref:GumC family protein n=1 Tax=Methylobacterium soli TaxID=553447 RepID=UPI0017858183|nr:Wzz/FepE/Etk N-terminal domain-containing protein [Methylobacterium soli]GJE42574.1 hypothetical protein AEGHOMDF_1746 [Methylobacterium soli]
MTHIFTAGRPEFARDAQSSEHFPPASREARFDIGASLRGHAWLIAAIVAVSMIAGIAYSQMAPKWYSASALLLIREPKSANLTGGSGSGDGVANTILVENQIEIMRSDRILRRAAETLALRSDPEFAKPKAWPFGLAAVGEGTPEVSTQWVVDQLRERLGVKRVGLSQLVEISFRMRDPDKAAQFANAIVESFITDQYEFKAQDNARELQALGGRVEELRMQSFAAEKAAQSSKDDGLPGDAAAAQASAGPIESGRGYARSYESVEKERAGRAREFAESQARIRELDSVARSTRAAYEKLLQRSIELSGWTPASEASVQRVAPATSPTRPSWPRLLPILLTFVVLGGAAGCAIALLLGRFQRAS